MTSETLIEESLTNDDQYVYVDMHGLPSTNLQDAAVDNIYVLGLDTSNPAVQIGNSTYIGEYSDAIGTNLFFSETSKSKEASSKLTYHSKSAKVLTLKRAFITPKESSQQDKPACEPPRENEAVDLGDVETEAASPEIRPMSGSSEEKVYGNATTAKCSDTSND